MLVSILENNFFLAGMPSPLPDDFRALPVFRALFDSDWNRFHSSYLLSFA